MTMNEDLEAMKAALTRQLDTIDVTARQAGCAREELRTPSGDFIASPVLVALANVELALDARR